MSRCQPVLLMTRPEPDSRAFAGTLRGCFDLVISPLFDVQVAESLPPIAADCGVIFTSINGVRAWQALGGQVHHPCFAVGEATGRAARAIGFDPICAQGTAADMIPMIIRAAPTVPLVHARGRHARGGVADALVAAGIDTQAVVLYDQKAMSLNKDAISVLCGNRAVIAPLFSPRTAALFQAQAVITTPVAVVAMSDAVAESLEQIAVQRVDIAAHPSADSMRRTVQRLLDADRWVEGREDAQ